MTPPGCAIRRYRHGDLDVVTVANDELRLSFLPQVGGRLIALRVRGSEALWRNPAFLDEALRPVRPRATWPTPDGTMASWANVGGSKTWPAPQGWSGTGGGVGGGGGGGWPGPPDEVLDSGPYAAEVSVTVDGAAQVVLTSGVDPATGLQITRAITLPATGLRFFQTNTFHNRSTRPVRWSIWEVAQIDARPVDGGPGRVQVETSGPQEPIRMIEAAGELRYEHGPGVISVPVQDTVGKLGFTATTGRIRWLRGDGLQIAMSSRPDPDGVYPDGGCQVELWLQYPVPEPIAELGGLHPDAYVVELELLSPLATIPPGECLSLDVDWLCTPPATVRPGSAAAAQPPGEDAQRGGPAEHAGEQPGRGVDRRQRAVWGEQFLQQ